MNKKISLLPLFFMVCMNAFSAVNDASYGGFKFSEDEKTSKIQKEVYDRVIEYQNALNDSDTSKILTLFSEESYSQWNDKLTADTDEKRKEQYDNLFSSEKFETDFAFDTIWVDGNVAIVRTHHHKGSVVTDIKNNRSIIDLNREVFVMHKENNVWKIFLYTFNTNPLQGVS